MFRETAMPQFTIKKVVQCSGVGLHSGKMVDLTLRPAEVDSGINFFINSAQGDRRIALAPDRVVATGLATTIGTDGASISTVEHLLATVRGLGIDNLRIETKGSELPIMDGSAAPFVLLFKNAGIKAQPAQRRVWRVKKAFSHAQGDKFIQAEPYAGFQVDYSIDFAHPLIGTQRLCLDLDREGFNQVAKARTFGFLREVEALYARGLALGGSLDNSVVLDEHGVVNPEGLRCPDEFVRHKILDFIGDMAMLDLPLQGKFTVRCSGHALNNQFLRLLYENRAIYLERAELAEKERTHAPAQRRRALHLPRPLEHRVPA
jgi:UDP-3-O-[3-hydroxymyristoyl] N-acetylglucosamine deacetylase